MAPKIGDVTIEGDYDGDLALRQAKKNVNDISKVLSDGFEKNGRTSGDAWAENFSKTMRDRMSDVQMPFFDNMRKRADKAGSGTGILYSRGFTTEMRQRIKQSVDDSISELARLGEPGGLERLVKKVGNVDVAMRRYEEALRDASDAGAINAYHTERLTAAVEEQERVLRAKLEAQKQESQTLIDRSKLEGQLIRQIYEAIGARRNHAAVQLQDRLETVIGTDAMKKYSASIREATEESKKAIGPIFDRAAAQRVAVRQMQIAIKSGDRNEISLRRNKLETIAGTGALKRLGIVIPDVAKKGSLLSRVWGGMSRNGKQWTLIIGAIASALSTLSVLGSAAGGALAVLGNAAVTLVAGIGLSIVGFQGLFAEGMKLTESAQASKTAFQELGQAFKDLQPGIVNAMFDGMAASIENLTTNLLPGIEGNLNALAAAVGDALGSLFDMFASPEAISIFNGLLDSASKTIGPLLQGIGGLFLGILAVFEQASPLAESFAGWLQQIGTDFLAWTQSDAGRARISEWLETAERILPLVGELIVAAGQALADLVTPSSIANAEGFLGSLTSFMEPLSGLLDILGELDIFGILAAALSTLGDALAPLQGPLSDLASLIGTTLKAAIDTLGPAFGALAGFLAPIISAVVDFLTPIFERLANDVLPVLVEAWGQIMEALAPVGTALQGLVEAMQPVVSFLIDVLLNAFNLVFPAIQFVIEMVVGIITGLINGLTNIFAGITMVVENWGTDWGAVWDGIWLTLQGIVEFIWNLISATLVGRAFGLLKTGLTSVGSFFTTIWTGIQNFVRTAITNVSTVITNVMNTIRAGWTAIWNGIKSVASTVWSAIKTAISTAVNAVKTVINDTLNTIKTIWSTIWEGLKTAAKTVWDGIKNVIKTPIDAIVGFINGLKGPIDAAIGWFNSLFGAADSAQNKSAASLGTGGGGRQIEMAAGGILRSATSVVAGEAGPEAFVPLNRPLSQVNPDVRWISAFAQGKMLPQVASAPSGPSVVFEPGSVVVQGADDPRATAFEVMDLVAERIAS